MAGSSAGYCYSDLSSSGNPNMQTPHLSNQLQTFDTNSEIYNLTAGMEMIEFPSKNLHQENSSSVLWKGFCNKPENNIGSSSSKVINEPNSSEFYPHDLAGISDITVNISPDSYHQNRLMVDDSNLRCVFPCEGNERPSQGLSLSLSSSNPSTIGLQSFELRQQDDLRFGPSSSRSVNVQNPSNLMPGFFHFGNSKLLRPTQELLNEFCNLGTKQNVEDSKKKLQKNGECHDDQESDIKNQSLYSLDLLELQKRKAKLLHMLEEVDRRYKNYCDQMKALVSSFESVAGNGAATVYSTLALRAMSRHFRCLRDGIVSQIKATKKAMGDKDTAAPGTSKGETPRLRFIDQSSRQHRHFQQMSMLESHPWRPQRGLPERSVSVLRAWLFEHFLHPYPSDVDKHILARQTGLSRSQVSNWFINARVRLWKPMVEEMYLEELKERDAVGGLEVENLDENESLQNQNLSINEDQKPTHDQLVRIDSECLSSIINNPEKINDKKNKTLQNELQNQAFGRVVGDSYSAMELDFSSSYTDHHTATGGSGSYVENVGVHSYTAAAGGVSLTLGLQQHGGVSLSFSPTSQNSIFYRRHHMEDCQTVQYSLLDSESQTLPYRNLMGAQFLHDLAG